MTTPDMSAAVRSANPSDIPMTETGYFKWLESKAPDNIHSITTKRQYLEEVFGFVVGEHRIGEDTNRTLRYIQAWYFDCKIRPTLKRQGGEEDQTND